MTTVIPSQGMVLWDRYGSKTRIADIFGFDISCDPPLPITANGKPIGRYAIANDAGFLCFPGAVPMKDSNSVKSFLAMPLGASIEQLGWYA